VIEHSVKEGRTVFSVKVVPRASRSEVVGEQEGRLKIRIAAPPVDGAANSEVVRLLAKVLDVPRSAVQILSGEASRTKRISVAGLNPDKLKMLAEAER